jgi:hypothetical protein
MCLLHFARTTNVPVPATTTSPPTEREDLGGKYEQAEVAGLHSLPTWLGHVLVNMRRDVRCGVQRTSRILLDSIRWTVRPPSGGVVAPDPRSG